MSLFEELKEHIYTAYKTETTVTEAESLAAKSLAASLELADTLSSVELDVRMRKSGLEGLRSAFYLAEVKKYDKKPTESFIEATINSTDEIVAAERALAKAEVECTRLRSYAGVFREAHQYFRSIMKAGFSNQ